MSPRLTIVVATARNGVIGRQGQLPWHLPADLKHFRRLTWGHPILMGRRTHESIGRPLPGRHNIVLTRQRGYQPRSSDADPAGTVTVVASLEEGLAAAGSAPELFVIGGGEIYQLAFPLACTVHRTLVEVEVEGDTRFPELEQAEWHLVAEEAHPPDRRHPHAYRFQTYVRRDRLQASGGAGGERSRPRSSCRC